MEIEKLSIDGKTTTLKVADKILSAKINKKLVSNVLYKTNANYKGRKAKTKQKNEKEQMILINLTYGRNKTISLYFNFSSNRNFSNRKT